MQKHQTEIRTRFLLLAFVSFLTFISIALIGPAPLNFEPSIEGGIYSSVSISIFFNLFVLTLIFDFLVAWGILKIKQLPAFLYSSGFGLVNVVLLIIDTERISHSPFIENLIEEQFGTDGEIVMIVTIIGIITILLFYFSVKLEKSSGN